MTQADVGGVPPENPARHDAARGGFWHGRSALVMPAIVGAFSLFLLVGSALLDPGEAEFPGPRFVPVIVGVVAWLGLYLRDRKLLALVPLASD